MKAVAIAICKAAPRKKVKAEAKAKAKAEAKPKAEPQTYEQLKTNGPPNPKLAHQFAVYERLVSEGIEFKHEVQVYTVQTPGKYYMLDFLIKRPWGYLNVEIDEHMQLQPSHVRSAPRTTAATGNSLIPKVHDSNLLKFLWRSLEFRCAWPKCIEIT